MFGTRWALRLCRHFTQIEDLDLSQIGDGSLGFFADWVEHSVFRRFEINASVLDWVFTICTNLWILFELVCVGPLALGSRS